MGDKPLSEPMMTKFNNVYMCSTGGRWLNSLAPGRSECDSKNVIFNLVLVIGIFRSSHDNALRWMPQDLTDDKSTLVQLMAWCQQATRHYLSQCWLSSFLPYGIARPQWVKAPHWWSGCISIRSVAKFRWTAIEFQWLFSSNV